MATKKTELKANADWGGHYEGEDKVSGTKWE
jgi:hypothetical protein